MNSPRKTINKLWYMYLGRTTCVVSEEWAQQLPHQITLVGDFSLCQEMNWELALVAHKLILWSLCCLISPRSTQKMTCFRAYHHTLEGSWYVQTGLFFWLQLQMPIFLHIQQIRKLNGFPLNGRLLTERGFNSHIAIWRRPQESHLMEARNRKYVPGNWIMPRRITDIY